MVDLDTVQPPGGDQLARQLHTVVNAGVRQHDHCAACLDDIQHGIHRLIPRRVQDAPAHGLEPEQRFVYGIIHAVGQTVLPQHPHDLRLEQRTAVLRKLERLLGAELGTDGFQLLAALQHGGQAALGHHGGKVRQRGAVVGPVAEQMHAMGALVVVGGQLGGRDEVDAVLHGMGIGVAHAPDRIVVGDGQMGHPRAGRQKRQLVRRGRTVGEGRMGMQITGHGRHLTCECGCYGTYYYTTSRGRIASRGGQCPPLQILRYFLSFFSSSKYSASSSMSASVRVSVSARAATKLRGLPPKRRPHRLRLSADRYAARVRAAV